MLASVSVHYFESQRNLKFYILGQLGNKVNIQATCKRNMKSVVAGTLCREIQNVEKRTPSRPIHRTYGSWGRLRVKGGTGSHAPSDRDSTKVKF